MTELRIRRRAVLGMVTAFPTAYIGCTSVSATHALVAGSTPRALCGHAGVTPQMFGAMADGEADDSVAVQAAINTLQCVHFPRGRYSVGELRIPAAASGAAYRGSGSDNYSGQGGTTLIANRAGQRSIFTLAEHADNIRFADMRIDAASRADFCIDGRFGAQLSLSNCGFFASRICGFVSQQGLARIDRVYSARHAATGFQVFSDSTITNSEFTGGRIPLHLTAGGNRLNNVWVNSGTECCLLLSPLDLKTNHINTSITNLYAGETDSGDLESPIVVFRGMGTNLVQQVQLSTSHLVCASPPPKINIGLLIDNCRDVVVTNIATLGHSTRLQEPSLRRAVEIRSSSNVTLTASVFRFCGKGAVLLSRAHAVILNGVVFSDWTQESTDEHDISAIRIADDQSYGVISNCIFDSPGDNTQAVAIRGGDRRRFVFTANLIRYPSQLVWDGLSDSQVPGNVRMGASAERP